MIYRFITAIFISVIVSSCIVSKKKFDDMLAQKVKAEGELADKRKALDLANANISQLNESLKKNKKEHFASKIVYFLIAITSHYEVIS